MQRQHRAWKRRRGRPAIGDRERRRGGQRVRGPRRPGPGGGHRHLDLAGQQPAQRDLPRGPRLRDPDGRHLRTDLRYGRQLPLPLHHPWRGHVGHGHRGSSGAARAMKDSHLNPDPPGGSAWALLPLRLMVGFGFAAHGYAKLSRGPEHFASILDSLGVPLPHLVAWVTALLEFFGGISVMAGAFVVLLSLPLAIIMVTAMFSVHLQYGFSSIRLTAVTAEGAQFGPIGYELNLLYIAGLLALALHGAGRLSVDQWLKARKQGAPGLRLLGSRDAAGAAPRVRVALLVS